LGAQLKEGTPTITEVFRVAARSCGTAGDPPRYKLPLWAAWKERCNLPPSAAASNAGLLRIHSNRHNQPVIEQEVSLLDLNTCKPIDVIYLSLYLFISGKS